MAEETRPSNMFGSPLKKQNSLDNLRRHSSLTTILSRPIMSTKNSIAPNLLTQESSFFETVENDNEKNFPYEFVNQLEPFGSPRSKGGKCKCTCEFSDLKAILNLPTEINYHSLFYGCETCGSRPGSRLCMWCWKSFCNKHSRRHFSETLETHRVFVDGEMASYESIFWCCKCKSYAISEDFDTLLESLCDKGTYVDHPITDKHTNGYKTIPFTVVASTMQCWRSSNEDTYIVVPNLKDVPHITLFGVFDGHGGALTARYAADHLPTLLTRELDETTDYKIALKNSFIKVDQNLKEECDREEVGTCGTTATVVLFIEGRIFCACAGDSRAVLCRKGKAMDLSVDHNPSNPVEKERILAAGASIQGDSRVDGLLGVSRAIGDFDFKQAGNLPPELQAVTVVPDVNETFFTPDDHFVIIASDGLWNCLESEEVVKFIQKELLEHKNGNRAVEKLLDTCVAPPLPEGGTDGCVGTDNITIILIINNSCS